MDRLLAMPAAVIEFAIAFTGGVLRAASTPGPGQEAIIGLSIVVLAPGALILLFILMTSSMRRACESAKRLVDAFDCSTLGQDMPPRKPQRSQEEEAERMRKRRELARAINRTR